MSKIFSFFNLVIGMGWAKSGTWAITSSEEQRIYLLSLHIVKQDEDKALSFIMGPVAITIGIVK